MSHKQLEEMDQKELVAKFEQQIGDMETEYSNVESDYDKAREYFEHSQKPTGVPADKEYIEENLLTDMVLRLIGGLVGGKFSPILKGGGANAESIRELFLDILDENDFKESLIETIANYYYVEGFPGLKVIFNPRRRSKYGLGFPEIHVLQPGTLLLDNNSIDLKHRDDLVRVHKIKVPQYIAEQRYPEFKDKIVQSQQGFNNRDTEPFVDLYEMQHKRTKIEKNADGLDEEKDTYLISRVINRTVVVKREKDEKFLQPSRFNRFSILGIYHTPRVKTAKYPIGPVQRLKDTQDQLNITSSVILDAVKSSIKMQAIVTGANKDDKAELIKSMTQTDGIGFIKNPQAKVNVMYSNPLVRPVVEWHQMTRERFRDISGKYQPDAGQSLGQQSGKAIALLTQRGDLPEFTSKNHIEEGLTEMGWLLFECIQSKMNQPFDINRQIDGKDQKIYFNQAGSGSVADDNLNQSSDGFVNKLQNVPVDSMKFVMEVEMNLLASQELQMNKAVLMRNSGALSLKDYIRQMYPNSWKEKLENITKENKVLGLIQKVQESTPELLDHVLQQMDQFIKLEKETEGDTA